MATPLVQHCPICGHAGVGELGLTTAELMNSYFICECCGCEFGLDDNAEYRRRWIQNGCQWFSSQSSPPPDWKPSEQLKNANMRWRR